jgi:nucleoside-diphosphate-sugar epimerase
LKTLVTGATGFIGKHLVKTLVKQGKDIRCLVRQNSDRKYLEDLGVELFYGDLLLKESLMDVGKDINIVYHLAGEVHSHRCGDYYEINVTGTRNLVEECLPANIERFIYLSSIAAVGPNHGNLLTEESPCKPVNPYGKSKLEKEKILITYFEKFKLPIVILRAPIVYGPLDQHNIITKILQMISEDRFLLIGNGKNLRSLCYIDNLIQGLVCIEKSHNSIGEIYFISDERVYTFNEIFQIIAQQLGIRLKETHLPKCIGRACGLTCKLLATMGFYSLSLNAIWNMVLDMACDISKAKRELNFNPKIDIREGMQKVVKYYIKEVSNDFS